MSTRSKRRRQGEQSSGIRPFIPSTPFDFSNWENWPKCTDDTDSNHIFGQRNKPSEEDKYGFPGGKAEVCEVYNRICWRNNRMKRVIDASNWHYMVSVQEKDNDRCLAYALIERWWPTTHTFHLPMLEVGFTPVDFTSLTGIPVGMGHPVPWEDFGPEISGDDIKERRVARAVNLLPDVNNLMEKDRKGISCARLKKWLLNQDIPADTYSRAPSTSDPWNVDSLIDDPLTAEELQILRAFFLLALGEIWFPVSKKFVCCELIGAVEDVHLVGTYDWGSAILANMYYSLDHMARTKLKCAQFCWTLLQVTTQYFWDNCAK